MSLTITIITPSFNHGKYIERTINSVLSQQIAGLEYLVMDGESRDNTLDCLKKYEDRLRWFSEVDRGQAHAVNKGLLKAKGEVIGWLNSDDVYYPGALDFVLTYFETHPDIDLIYGDGVFIDENDQEVGLYPTESWSFKRLKQRCYISQPAVFFRRKLVLAYGGLNEELKYGMDYEFWLRLACKGAQFAYLPKILAATRLHENTKTEQSAIAAHEESIQLVSHYVKIIPAYRIMSYAHAIFEDRNKSARVRNIREGWVLLALFLKEAFRRNHWRGIWTCFAMPFILLRIFI